MEGGAADHAAEHVAAPLVAGADPVGDQEGGGPGVVGDQAEGVLHPVIAKRRRGKPGGNALPKALEDVGLVHGGQPAHHHGQPLQSHAGVNADLTEGGARAVGRLVELVEDQVPDLDPAGAVPGRAFGLAAAGPLAAVEVDLAVWATRA